MNVKISSELSGELQFEMSAENFIQLLGAATRYAADSESSETVTTIYANGEPCQQEVTREPMTTPETHGRIRTLFGDYKSRIPISTVLPKVKKQEESYKGFLLIQCEDCGKIRGFCAKTPQTEYFCDCGNTTKLENLLPAFLKCKSCDGTFRYMTNVRDRKFAFHCLNCGRKISLALNDREDTFVSEK